DIIYLGDSTICSRGKKDSDDRCISEMVRDMLPRYSLGRVTHEAYQMDLYLEFCKYICRQKNHPSIIIIPINMRSFAPGWDMKPQFQFEKETIILRGGLKRVLMSAFYKPLVLFKYNFFSINMKQYKNTPVFDGDKQVGLVKDFTNRSFLKLSRENIKKSTLFYYMYSLNKKHRKILSMMEAARLLSRKNIKAVFYIAPIDCETGEKCFPGRFTRRLEENTRLIGSLLAEENTEVLDLSNSLKANAFYWRIYPNEYLVESGRMYVARKISSFIRGREQTESAD
ncbi:MAG: hypothetical protein GY757_59680, partial [bacterium]|nr:hypothetical protein [bacterium]